MNEMYTSEEAKSMRAGKAEAAWLVHEFGDPNMEDYQDPYADVSDNVVPAPAIKVDNSVRVEADVAAIRAEFALMLERKGVREKSQTQ